jgi:serine/threonine protein kinase
MTAGNGAQGQASQKDARVGPFLLIDELAAGGNARVFRARYHPDGPIDRTLGLVEGDVVVIKVLRDSAVRDPKQVNAFTREAELLAMIEHPHVVRAITRGVTGGRIWTALEYVEGDDLSTLFQAMRQESLRLKPEVALVVAADLLAGLSAAQGVLDPRGRPLGLIHRDVSPKNVIIDIKGMTKVADFGAALLSLREEPNTDVTGTPGFLAPEQAKGEQLTQGVDVYATGLLLFEMLTGVRAFDVDAYPDQALLDAHAQNKRAPWPRGVQIPLDVKALVEQALSPEPEGRPADAASMYQLVESLLPDPDEARYCLSVVSRDLVLSNPERPAPLFVS